MRKLVQDIIDGVRSRAAGLWKRLAPHAGAVVFSGAAADIVRSRHDLVVENAMLRQQIIVLRRKHSHPKFTRTDRLILVLGAAVLPGWRRAVAIVQPETLLRWHREGFRMLWRRQSKAINSRHRLPVETIEVIREMAAKNRLWVAERIRGELLKLGIRVSKRTIQNYMAPLVTVGGMVRNGLPS